ncbi:MAG TPA: hypothetical protein VLJ38_12610 [Polyangiaceae bacterium]|nr:hypothetical protein [Polyangiaceae bacterium]
MQIGVWMQRGLALAAGLACCAFSRSARADGQDFHEDVRVPSVPAWLTVPAELGHSAAWLRHSEGPAYRFRAALLPGVSAGSFGFHAALEAVYRNPEWDLGLGGRLSFRVATLVGGFVPVRLLAEVTHLVVTTGGNASGGVQLGLGRLVHLAALYGHDTDRPVNYFELRLGFDLASLWDPIGAVVRDVPQQDAVAGAR